ncbi:MAG: hypothetical protein KGI71_04315, partial [Patescibacteria group bacterium]|nr:hypothetical protein [Patescibacteria group bacterium]
RSHKMINRNRHHRNIVEKYGIECIKVFVFPCESEEQAIADEIKQITQLRQDGYALVNQTNGGDGIAGFSHSYETRKKMSDAAKGKPKSIEHRKKISINNSLRSEETREKMRAAKIGGRLSEQHRKKISEAVKRYWANDARAEQHRKSLARRACNPSSNESESGSSGGCELARNLN